MRLRRVRLYAPGSCASCDRALDAGDWVLKDLDGGALFCSEECADLTRMRDEIEQEGPPLPEDA